MSNFPAIRDPDEGFQESYFKPQIKNDFESGHVQSRPRSTVGKFRWRLQYSLLEPTEYETLRQFFEDHIGDTFTWTHPISGVHYIVRFTDDELSSTVRVKDLRDVSVSLEESV